MTRRKQNMAAFPLIKLETFSRSFPSCQFLLALVLYSLFHTTVCTDNGIDCNSFESSYTAGTNAYSAERWVECYNGIKNADNAYKCYKQKVVGCRKFCQDEFKSVDVKSRSDLEFYESSLYRSDCLRKCFSSKKVDQNLLKSKAKTDLENLQHYNYLQLCAYKVSYNDILYMYVLIRNASLQGTSI